jgi:formate hydrogenlyase transcriptional activator
MNSQKPIFAERIATMAEREAPMAMRADVGVCSPAPSDPRRHIETALVKAAQSLNARLDVQGVCQAVIDAVEEAFDARSAWVLLYDASSRQLRTQAARGHGSDAFQGLAVAPSVGILGLAFTTGKVVFVPSVKEEERWFDPARVHAADLQSVFTVPLLHDRDILGVVGLDSPLFSVERLPTDAHIGLLEALAGQAATAIANARLYSASEEDRRRLQALLHEQRRLRTQVTHLEEQVKTAGSFHGIVGDSPELREVLKQASLAAPANITILLLGETGSGKELVARFIHEHSGRVRHPFVAVNCAALPEGLVESQLFGHEKGAFTGAVARQSGRFEIAHRGTLFLDEIGDLPLEAQAKLLRVLQDGQVERIGSAQAVPVDVRVVGATNQDLEEAVAAHRFRADLYYRVSVFPIHIPPLRERRADIASLADYFTKLFAMRLRKTTTGITPAALRRLCEYDWPGNVRELQNVIERAVILTAGPALELDAIGLSDHGGRLPTPVQSPAPVIAFAEAQRRAIVAALEAAQWRVSGHGGAAELLGVKPTTLHAKMKKLDIRRD